MSGSYSPEPGQTENSALPRGYAPITGVSVCIRKVSIAIACCSRRWRSANLWRGPQPLLTTDVTNWIGSYRGVAAGGLHGSRGLVTLPGRGTEIHFRHVVGELFGDGHGRRAFRAISAAKLWPPAGRRCPGLPSRVSIDEAPYESHFQPRRKLPLPFKQLAGLVFDKQQRVHGVRWGSFRK
jgi:hypothetical protein